MEIKKDKPIIYRWAIYESMEGQEINSINYYSQQFRDYKKCKDALVYLINNLYFDDSNDFPDLRLINEYDFKCDFAFTERDNDERVYYRVEQLIKGVWE